MICESSDRNSTSETPPPYTFTFAADHSLRHPLAAPHLHALGPASARIVIRQIPRDP